jgi:hypothetical protein
LRTCSDGSWGPPSLLYNGNRVFPGVKSGRSVKLTPYLLVPRSRKKSGAIPLLSVRAFAAYNRVKPTRLSNLQGRSLKGNTRKFTVSKRYAYRERFRICACSKRKVSAAGYESY